MYEIRMFSEKLIFLPCCEFRMKLFLDLSGEPQWIIQIIVRGKDRRKPPSSIHLNRLTRKVFKRPLQLTIAI